MSNTPGDSKVVRVGRTIAGPSPPPVLAHTVMLETSVLGWRFEIVNIVSMVISVHVWLLPTEYLMVYWWRIPLRGAGSSQVKMTLRSFASPARLRTLDGPEYY